MERRPVVVATQRMTVYELRLGGTAAAPRYVAAPDPDAAAAASGLGRHQVRRVEPLPMHLFDPPCAEGLSQELVSLAYRSGDVARREAARIVEGLRNGEWEEDLEARRPGICPEELYAGEDPADVWHEAAPAGCRAFAELLAAARAAGAAISEADEAGAYAAALRGRLVFDVARRASDVLEEGW